MKIKSYSITDLTFDPNNARKHPEANLKALEESLLQFGQQKPVVITSAGVIVAGNGTIEAAGRLGWSEIMAVEVPNSWSKEKIAAFALADNRTAELAQWDARELLDQLEQLAEFDMNALGFDAWERPADTGNSDGEPIESRGLGTPIISFEIVFDDADQQTVWFNFLKTARMLHPEAETNAERITAALLDYMGSQNG
jgi:ParB-like chromosome segregation protein Spo0J